MTLADLPVALRPVQVAEVLGLHVETIYDLIADGRLRATNVGRGGKRPTYRVRRDDLESYLQGDTNQGKQISHTA